MIIGFDPALVARARSSRHNICVTEPLYSGVAWQFGLQWGRELQRSDRKKEPRVWDFTLQSNRSCLGPEVALVTTTESGCLAPVIAGGEAASRADRSRTTGIFTALPSEEETPAVIVHLKPSCCWTDMAETLRRLTNTSSFRVLQDKLESWHREYHVSSWISNERPKSDHGTSLHFTGGRGQTAICYRISFCLSL